MNSTGFVIDPCRSEAEAGSLRERLQEAARFLSTTTPARLLEPVIRDHSSLLRLLDLVSGLDHVGLLARPRPLVDLRRATAAAGFDADHQSFPSVIVARELALLGGRESVPTTIFRSRGRAGWVEVFMPHATEPGTVDDWVEHGVGAHVALSLRRGARFGELVEAMEGEDFRIPGFMNGRELQNPVMKVTALYFDRVSDPALRLEFCDWERGSRRSRRPAWLAEGLL